MPTKATTKKASAPKQVEVKRNTTLVRVFSEDKNGKDFKKLAEQFAEKHGYEVAG